MTEIKNIWENLQNSFADSGIKFRTISSDHLDELQCEIENLSTNNLVGKDLFKEELSDFEFNLPESIPEAKTIIIATVFSPPVKASFRFNTRQYTFVIPPTYIHDTDYEVIETMSKVLSSNGYLIKRANLPEKLLAVRSGLGKYGRNNIVYVDEMGSFHRPILLITDAPYTEDHWLDPQMHEQCKNCNGCINTCPTMAISGEKFLIDAEKCITFHNERNHPFPEWIKSEWHNALIGCMICQDNCPINKPYRDGGTVAAEFSQEESEMLLRNLSPDKLDNKIFTKLEKIAMIREYRHLARNLSVLLEN